jgi:hypothetical protein
LIAAARDFSTNDHARDFGRVAVLADGVPRIAWSMPLPALS